MRRPAVRRLQRRSLKAFGPKHEQRLTASFRAQEAFARRYGLRILTVVINLALASIFLTFAYLATLEMSASGLLDGPRRP